MIYHASYAFTLLFIKLINNLHEIVEGLIPIQTIREYGMECHIAIVRSKGD